MLRVPRRLHPEPRRVAQWCRGNPPSLLLNLIDVSASLLSDAVNWRFCLKLAHLPTWGSFMFW